jgi:hypothetical protein
MEEILFLGLFEREKCTYLGSILLGPEDIKS